MHRVSVAPIHGRDAMHRVSTAAFGIRHGKQHFKRDIVQNTVGNDKQVLNNRRIVFKNGRCESVFQQNIIEPSGLFSERLFVGGVFEIKGLAQGFDTVFKVWVFVFSDDLAIIFSNNKRDKI